jgi:hypothetical protein
METAMTARAAQRSGDALSNPGASMPLTGWAGTEPHHPPPCEGVLDVQHTNTAALAPLGWNPVPVGESGAGTSTLVNAPVGRDELATPPSPTSPGRVAADVRVRSGCAPDGAPAAARDHLGRHRRQPAAVPGLRVGGAVAPAHPGSSSGRCCSIHDMRRLREDREGVACLGERLDDAARQAVAPLDRLVGVGVGPHRDLLAGPPGRAQLGA